MQRRFFASFVASNTIFIKKIVFKLQSLVKIQCLNYNLLLIPLKQNTKMLYLEDYLESECYLLIYKQLKKLNSLFLETKQKSILLLEVRKIKYLK